MADIIAPQWGQPIIGEDSEASQELNLWMADVTDGVNNPEITKEDVEAVLTGEITSHTHPRPQVAKVLIDFGLSVDSTTPTTLTFTDDFVDPIYDTSTGFEVGVNKTGRFRIEYMNTVTGSTSNYRYTAQTDITVNGTPQASASNGYIRATGGSNHTTIFCNTILELTSGDLVGIDVSRINSVTGNATTEDGWIVITEV